MKYDFDTVYNRKNTGSLKYKNHPRFPNCSDLIPMWVADMDFKAAPEIITAIEHTTKHGIFGYTELDDEYYDSIIKWNKKRFDFDVERKWIVPVDSVMAGISVAIKAITNEDDAVMILQPVYYPFANVIIENKRNLIVSELLFEKTKYIIDFQDFENKIVENNVKALLFCSPHNPVGRVWDKDELLRVAEICLSYGVTIISDEIHSDLVFKKHYPIASLSEQIADNTIMLTSITKTFNLAGIRGANLIIPNQKLRSETESELHSRFSGGLSIFSVSAAKSAYQYGEEWLTELLEYLSNNVDYVLNSFKNTKIKAVKPEGTYLMWLDCRELALSDRELEEFFIKRCGVWLNNGCIFGKGGSGFMRMNVACPKKILERAVNNILNELDT